MPEVSIPGMAFRARLSKISGKNAVELLFRGDTITTIDITGDITETLIQSTLKQACAEADILHQITEATLVQVAGDLYKQSGLGDGKDLLPQEFEVKDETTELDQKLTIIISSLQDLHKRLDMIESKLERSSE